MRIVIYATALAACLSGEAQAILALKKLYNGMNQAAHNMQNNFNHALHSGEEAVAHAIHEGERGW